MRIFVAIPVYDGKLPVQTVSCLLTEIALAQASGDEIEVRFLPGCSNVGPGRNFLAREFLESPSERMVFLDSDVTFAPGDLLRIAKHDVDFVGGAYRYKTEAERYPIELLSKPGSSVGELGEVASVPGGFLSLSRNVFEKMKAAKPEQSYYDNFGRLEHCFFQARFEDARLYSEDCYFCKQWTDLGGKVFLDPNLNLTHWDHNKPYAGNVGLWLRNSVVTS